MMRLVQDNPACIICQPVKFWPIPGTELFRLVQNK
jgi:hypothetical protein